MHPINPFVRFDLLLDRLALLDATVDEMTLAHDQCRHEQYQLFVLVASNGVPMYKSECLICGAISGAIAYRSLTPQLKAGAGERIGRRPFLEKASAARTEAKAIRWQDGFYGMYLASPAWASKRLDVLRRANDWCEVCRVKPAEEINHLSYRRLGNEPLSDLQAVCRSCHRQYHEDRAELQADHRERTTR